MQVLEKNVEDSIFIPFAIEIIFESRKEVEDFKQLITNYRGDYNSGFDKIINNICYNCKRLRDIVGIF